MARILFGLLLLQIFTLAYCKCRDGWQEQFGNCYVFVNVQRSHHVASSICERYGSTLANPKNVSELEYLKKNAANKLTNTNQIWIGYSKGQDVLLDGYWNNSQTNLSEGICVALNNLGLLMVDNCFWQHSFVCQKIACAQDQYSCRNGICIPLYYVCVFGGSCGDDPEMQNCPKLCDYFYHSLSETISVTRSILKYGKCSFNIEVPIGYRIKLEFQLYNGTNINGLGIFGIKTSNDYLLVGQPPLNETKFYSRNNFVRVEYSKTNNEVGTVFEFNYTSIAIPSPILQATSNPQELSFPEDWTIFLDVELSWKIEATKASVIVLQLFELIFPNSGKNSFFIWYGNDMAVNITDSPENQTFTSNTNEVVIYFYSANAYRNASLNLTYQILYCVSAGYEIGPSRNECIPCAKGFYKNATDEVVEKCSPCPQNFTTSRNQGATTLKDCDLKLCMAGEFRNNTSNICQDCNEGYYQANVERSECLQCPENHTTLSKKSKSKDDCIFYCVSAGYEIGPSRSECIPCAKGFYKNATAEVVEKCSPCPQNFTTSRNQGATTLEDCDLKLCMAGEFRNNTSNICQDCNEGYYQANVEKTECFKCQENHTTLSKKSKSKDDCIFYCVSAGYEIGPSRNECIPCAKGFYKNATAEVVEKCSPCPQNFTTSRNQGATTLKDCDLKLCMAGKFRNNTSNTCQDCNEGYYQANVERSECLKCPENHTTLSKKSKSKDDCIFYCVSAGYEIGPSRNECIPCAKGFYKNATSEVEEKCSPCPQNFTTSRNQGATTLEDCDLMACPAGHMYNRSSVICMACPKGTYKSKRGYHPCIACTGIMTTFGNASTQETDCLIPNCPAGEEPTEDYLSCKKCSLGYYKSDSSSINCIQCPINTTTLQTGATSASQCPKKIVSNPAILNTVVIVYELQYSFVNCEINQAFYEGEIKSAMEKRIQEMSKGWNFCIGDCQVTVNVKCPTSNRKKRATGNSNTEVQIGNVKSNVDSKTKDERTLAKNIFTQDCKVNSIKYQVNSAKLMTCAVSTSCKYSKLVSDKCELCPAGTKAILTGCEDCPEGTYSSVNQRDCTNCKFPLTSKIRSNSSSQCVSKCILDSTYCKNGGICSNAVNDMLHVCFCGKKFSGEQCEIYNEPYDHGKWWIFVVIGCLGLVLLIIQLIVFLVRYSRKKHKEKTRKIQREGNDHSTQCFYGSPMQGHKANQPFATKWRDIGKLSY